MKKIYSLVAACFLFLSLPAQNIQWTWINGDNAINRSSVRGMKNVSDPKYKPGSRYLSASWTLPDNRFMLFGGNNNDTLTNDLWLYDINSNAWSWLGGGDTINQGGNYSNYTVTWIYDDGHGNSLSQKQNVIVNASSVNLVPDVTSLQDITGECSVTVTTRPTASKKCGGTIQGTTTDPMTYNKQGSYIITWHYTDGNNVISQKQNVIVRDITAPVPDVKSLPDITGQCSASVTNRPTATDNCAGTITGTTTDPLTYSKRGIYTITWIYDDGNDNMKSQEQNIIITAGSEGPVPDIINLPVITGQCSATITNTPTAISHCGKTITGTTSDPLSYKVQGNYTITWTYSDGNDNIATQIQQVIIKDAMAPVPVRLVLPDIIAECSIDLSLPPLALDNCAGLIHGKTKDAVAFSVPGAYDVTWIFDDENGNTVSQKQHVILKSLDLTMSAFPNPANNQFTLIVKSCNKTDKVVLRIYDVLGRLVYVKEPVNLDEKILAGLSFSAGTYFAQVTQGKERAIIKMIKLK